MAEYGIPAPKGGLYDEGPTSTQTSGPMDASDLNAPRNPFADRAKVHKLIINRIGGDPFQMRPKNSAKQIEQMLPQLFQQFFQRQGYVPGPNTLLQPEEIKAWETYVANIYKNAEAQETEKQKAIQKSYDTLAKQADADRKQYNALYWKTHPSEERMQASREKAMTQARQQAVDHMKFMEDKMGGGYFHPEPGPDGKPRKMTPAETSEYYLKKQEEFYRKIAPVYGINVPEGEGSQAEGVKQWLAKNPNLSLERIGNTLKGIDPKTRAEVLASLPAGQRNILDEVVRGQYGDTERLKTETLASTREARDLGVSSDKKKTSWLDLLSGEEVQKGKNEAPPTDRPGDESAQESELEKKRARLGEGGVGGGYEGSLPVIQAAWGTPDTINPAGIPGKPAPRGTEEEESLIRSGGMMHTIQEGPVEMLQNVWNWFTKPKPLPNPANIPTAELIRARNGEHPVYGYDTMSGQYFWKAPAEVAQTPEPPAPGNLPAPPGQGYDPVPEMESPLPSGSYRGRITQPEAAPSGRSFWDADPDAAFIT